MKIAYPTWLAKCDPAEIEEAYEEATVDCYGDEQGSGLVDMAIQELVFLLPPSFWVNESKLLTPLPLGALRGASI